MWYCQKNEYGVFRVKFDRGPDAVDIIFEGYHDQETAMRLVNYLNGGSGFPFELNPAHKRSFEGGAPGKFPAAEMPTVNHGI
jgi:hypothetical protein